MATDGVWMVLTLSAVPVTQALLESDVRPALVERVKVLSLVHRNVVKL